MFLKWRWFLTGYNLVFLVLRWGWGYYLFKCKYYPCLLLKGELAFRVILSEAHSVSQCLLWAALGWGLWGRGWMHRSSEGHALCISPSWYRSAQVGLRDGRGTMSWCLAQVTGHHYQSCIPGEYSSLPFSTTPHMWDTELWFKMTKSSDIVPITSFWRVRSKKELPLTVPPSQSMVLI